jgi:hypothetical protein
MNCIPCTLAVLSHHHSASRARIIAGLSGFFTLIQSRDGRDRYGAESPFDTMPREDRAYEQGGR